MAAQFDPYWVSVLDEYIKECIKCYMCPGWIFVPQKPHPLGNKYHTIVFAIYKVIYRVDIVEGADQPWGLGWKEFDDKPGMAGFMVRISKPLWVTGKLFIMYSGFFVLGGLILIFEKGIFGSALIKK